MTTITADEMNLKLRQIGYWPSYKDPIKSGVSFKVAYFERGENAKQMEELLGRLFSTYENVVVKRYSSPWWYTNCREADYRRISLKIDYFEEKPDDWDYWTIRVIVRNS